MDLPDPEVRSRRVLGFHRPEALLEWVGQPDTLRARRRRMPPLPPAGLRECQYEAIRGLEASLTANRPRALIQMTTGAGETFTAVSASYQLIKHVEARRILFLVGQGNLGRQTLREFQGYTPPDDPRRFTELYNVQHLTSNCPDPRRHLTFREVKELAEVLARAHPLFTPEHFRQLYERLQPEKVRRSQPERVLTDLISLVRFALEQEAELRPFPKTLEERFAA
ncbi:type III restriction protein res subunit [Meiothermus taiwanensis WR-220]|uniref:Type III restriction protein res subunit n=1 Tax=Meiothermus taiwanensis WR-220 TaxID=1339250 RepID=A0ABM6WJK9_9DEIN|nr:type III restriction protein res subunit [Meiothermus taiwanensis WR-220]